MNKIVLIDDNKSNQREIYGATFVDDGEYEDCLVHKEKLNENSDFSFLDDAACILLHDSLADYVNGRYESGGRMARDAVWEKIKANKIPYVFFSDGHPIIGEWSPTNKDVVRSIKKSEFYHNLKFFLDEYRESGIIDLRLIAYGKDFNKRELIYLLQQILDELNIVNDKDTLNLSSANKDLFERFFDRIKLVSNNVTFEKLCDSIKAGRLTVGKFKAYINSLASHAIKYTAKVPKHNILLLGNELSQERLSNLDNVTFKTLNTFQLGEKGEKEMFDNIASSIPSNTDAIIIDIDSTKTPDACLYYALAIRLSLHEKKIVAMAPIIFMSSMTPDIFKNSPYSTLLQTKGVSFETPLYTSIAVELMEPLSPIEYKTKFLDIIKIIPNATEGRHSLANQWGADVLSRMVVGNETNNELIKKARLSLYFKYVRALSLSTKEIETIINGVETTIDTTSREVIDATGKNILLIDDEADKGWKDVLSKMLPNSVIKPIKEQVPDYDSLSADAKKEIESGKYDLIFLDLRMNGVKEEDTLSPNEFSGMKILNAIKEQNRGNQVIMFTASNKAWNMKALLDAGADGYYIKESPEFAFPHSYSLSNAQNLCNNIRYCLSVSSEQRNIWESIKSIKRLMDSNNLANKYFSGMEVMHGLKYQTLISTELDVVWGLLRSNQEKKEQLSMLSLFKILEFMNEFFYTTNNKGQLCLIDSNYKELLFWENGTWLKKGEKSSLYKTRKIGNCILKNDIESTTSKIHNIMRYVGFDDNDKAYSHIRSLGNERNGYIHAKNSAVKSKNISLHNIEIWINAIKNLCIKL